MKRFLTLLVLCLLALTPPARADEPNPDDMYFNVYSLMLKAQALEEKGKAAEARTNYAEGLKILKEIQLDFPEWNPKVVKYRINDFETKATPPPATAKPAPVKSSGMQSAASETPAAATMSAGSGEPVEMKIKWMTGKRYVERLTLDADVNVSPPGQAEQKGQLNFTQGVTLSALKDRDGGGKELEVELQDTTINASMAGTTMYSYDAGKQPPAGGMAPPEVTAVVQKLKGSKLKFLTDASGKVESVEGIEDLVKRLALAADPSANPDDILKNIPAEAMGNVKDALANMSGLPDKPVKIGDTWSPKMGDMKGMPEGMQINYVYTFKGWEQHDGKRCALIQMTGDFNMKPGAATPPGMPNIKSRVSGKIWFDPETSMVVESSTKPDINVNMAMGQGAAGAGFAMTLHLTVDMKQLAMNDIQ